MRQPNLADAAGPTNLKLGSTAAVSPFPTPPAPRIFRAASCS
jgi:hypothetical protein